MVKLSRRNLLAAAAGTVAASAIPTSATASPQLRLIATEEAFATPEFLNTLQESRTGGSAQDRNRFFSSREFMAGLTDIDMRLADMDAAGIDVQLLSLLSPGVQVLDADVGTKLAAKVNDRLADIIHQHPRRFAGLAAVAPQNPQAAAAEIKRAMTELRLNGIIINSHTNGEFLDEPKFRPLLAAAEECQAPIYLHPTIPPESMIGPMTAYGLQAAIWGFAAETGLHAMRLLMSGAFDDFPGLQLVLGHMGEGIPYQFFRIDNRYLLANEALGAATPGRDRPLINHAFPGTRVLRRPPSEYFRTNFHITTSGVFWNESLEFAIKVMGADRIHFAIDYPFESSKRAAEFIRNAPLSHADKELIAHGNAERLFKISPAA